ncbi:MAG: transcriptional repressor LexA [Planctomycetota bacterium]
MPRPLTRRQLELLRTFRALQEKSGLSPTLVELGRAMGINRITAYGHVQALLQKGFLENLLPGASRGLELTALGREAVPSSRSGPSRDPVPQPARPSALPLLGRIAAGAPLEAVEEPRSFGWEDLVPAPGDRTYLLEVQGDSMIGDHIQEGDLILVDRDREPRNGSIVVAVLPDGEATLKRFYREAGGVFRLQPSNPSLQPIRVRELEVRGVVAGVIRRF